MRRWPVVLVACLAVAVGVPAAWYLTRPSANEGVPVASVGAPTASAQPRTESPASPARPGPLALPTLRTHPATATATEGRAPVRLQVPSVGIDAAVLPVGVDEHGFMVMPEQVRRVGWYRFGPAPGDPAGAAVLAGHVDTRQRGAGALFPLRRVGVGDRVTVTLDGGRTIGYRVIGKQTIIKQRLPVERLFARDGSPRLVLITCGGPFVPQLSSYRDNLVVLAVPQAGTP